MIVNEFWQPFQSRYIVNELEKWRKECETIFHRAVTEDAGGLAPVKDDNADLWKIGRQRVSVL